MPLQRVSRTRQDHVNRRASLSVRTAASHCARRAHLCGPPVAARRCVLERRKNPRLVSRNAERQIMSGFFVPHNLKAPLKGAKSGLLAGLTAAVKDMYDIAEERAGGGNPDWLAN